MAGFRQVYMGLAIAGLILAQQPTRRFLRFAEVEEVLAGLAAPDIPEAAAWDQWIRAQDREVRGRIDRGVEDSISNLILYGTSYTRLPRLESAEEAASAQGELVEAARTRVRELALALAGSPDNERVRFVREFLMRRGVVGRAVEEYLVRNLLRFVSEQRGYQEKLKAAGQTGDAGRVLFTRGTLYEQRGLSVDTSLLPNFAVEDTLRALMRKGVLTTGSIHRAAIIGPGLDFTDKRDGYDFYPLQTIQPFAVLEAVARLGLGQPGEVRMVALDLNPAVNAHLRRLAEQARAGQPYVVQLPRDAAAEWSPEAVSYWEHFGEILGSRATPLPVPPALSGRRGTPGVVLRAVAIRPRYAARVEARDLDIVAQTLDLAPGDGFDLVVATNVLVYYDLFHQALAMAAIARLMNPGGVFLANHALAAQHPRGLEYLGRRSLSYSISGAYGDDVVVYRRRL